VCNDGFKIKEKKKNYTYNYPCAFCNSQQNLAQKENSPIKKGHTKEKLTIFFKFQQAIYLYSSRQYHAFVSLHWVMTFSKGKLSIV